MQALLENVWAQLGAIAIAIASGWVVVYFLYIEYKKILDKYLCLLKDNVKQQADFSTNINVLSDNLSKNDKTIEELARMLSEFVVSSTDREQQLLGNQSESLHNLAQTIQQFRTDILYNNQQQAHIEQQIQNRLRDVIIEISEKIGGTR